MRNLISLFAALTLILGFFSSCGPAAAPEEESFDPAILQGTWKMTAYQPSDTNTTVAPDFVQYKIYTKDHFFFITYNEASKQFLQAGGGTYTVDRDSFTETIAFVSWDSTMAGTKYTFAYTAAGDAFDQMGLMKATSPDEEDFMLHEKYERVEPGIAAAKDQDPIIGLWKMQRASYSEDEPQPMPGDMEAYKVITPGYFYIGAYHTETGKMDGVVFGSCQISDSQYNEHILGTSRDSTIIGMTIEYPKDVKGNEFNQVGKVMDVIIKEQFTRSE